MAFTAQGLPRRSKVVSLTAPVGGLNDVDAVASMPENFCLELDNWIPSTSQQTIRRGYDEWVADIGELTSVTATTAMVSQTWTLACTDDSTPGSEVWSVTGSVSGAQAADATTGVAYSSDDGSLDFTITDGSTDFQAGDEFTFVTYATTPVLSLHQYSATDGTYKIFAATELNLYDVTNGATNPSSVLGINATKMRSTQLSNTGGAYLVMTGYGTQVPVLFNGTSWTEFSESATPTTPGQINGISPAQLSFVTTFKRRLWFIEDNSMTVWYLPTDSVAGTLKPFYLGGNFHRGGYVSEILSWSLDAGDGLDDKLVFRSSEGELLIYAGDDPDALPEDPASFKLQSMFYVSPPVGNRSSVDLGGDSVLLTRSGLVQLSRIVQGDANIALYENTLSRNISTTLKDIVALDYASPAWEIHALPWLPGLIVSIPTDENSQPAQFVMNTINGAWARWDLPAQCLLDTPRGLLFGGAGAVYRYGTVYKDGVSRSGSGGVPVQASLFSAFNYFGDPTTLKSFKMIRPLFQSSANISFLVGLNTDFDETPLAGTPDNPWTDNQSAVWDTSEWDGANWGSAANNLRPWCGVSGLGFCAAVLLKVAADTTISLSAFQVVYEEGSSI
jgi:hypothetical protein